MSLAPRPRACLVALALAVASATTGCFIESNNDPEPVAVVSPTTPSTGTLVVQWTIDGQQDAFRCSQSAVASIEVTVYRADGTSAGTFVQDCGAFATSIVLERGDYTARGVLFDASSRPRTTSVNLRAFSILGSDQLNIPIDFPVDSFFQPNY